MNKLRIYGWIMIMLNASLIFFFCLWFLGLIPLYYIELPPHPIDYIYMFLVFTNMLFNPIYFICLKPKKEAN